MKKFIILIFCLLLSACSNDSNKQGEIAVATDTVIFEATGIVNEKDIVISEKETNIQTPDEIEEDDIYPIVICSSKRQDGYVVGGLINGKIIDFQENDNHKFFELTGKEKYMIFSSAGEPIVNQGVNIEKHYVGATGTYEFTVSLEDGIPLNTGDFYVGIGNIATPVKFGAEDFIDENGSFCVDFDNDGCTERVIINKTEDSGYVSISLENNEGATILDEFYIGDTYTTEFGLLPIDVDDDNRKELVIMTDGHDYSTEVFEITSNDYERIIGYYMSN